MTTQSTQPHEINPMTSSKIAAKREYNMRENLSEVIDLIANVEASGIDLKLHQIQQRDLATEIDLWEFLDGYKDLNVYCDKTGQIVDNFDHEFVKLLLKTHGDVRTRELLSNAKRNRIHANWIFTDPKALNALSETDPIGYFVYAASTILRVYQPYWQNKETHDTGANDKWRLDKAECYLTMQSQLKSTLVDKTLLIEMNELMRRYLTITKTLNAINQVKFSKECRKLQSLPSMLQQFKSEIIASIEAIIEHEYRIHKIKTTLTYADIINLNLKYEGHSNFRQQKKIKGATDIDDIMMIVDEFTPAMKSVKHMVAMAEVEDKVKQMQTRKEVVKHRGGAITFAIPQTKPKTIPLTFAQSLKQRWSK